MFVKAPPIELIREHGRSLEEAKYVQNFVQKFNLYCAAGIPVLRTTGISYEVPRFINPSEALQLLRDGEPLILKRSFKLRPV